MDAIHTLMAGHRGLAVGVLYLLLVLVSALVLRNMADDDYEDD